MYEGGIRCDSLTSPKEDRYLRAADGDVLLLDEDPDGDAPAVQGDHGPAHVRVCECKHAHVQRGGSGQDVSEKMVHGRLLAVSQWADTGTGGAGGEEMNLFHLTAVCHSE